MRIPHLRAASVCLAWLVAAVVPTGIGAQEKPVAFVHGFKSDPSTWDAAASALRTHLHIRTTQPTLPWDQPYNDQANALDLQLQITPGFADAPILVGHSNGGIVSRLVGGRKSLEGIITLASPHGGAPLVTHLGGLVGWSSAALYAMWNVADVFSWYSWIGPYDDYNIFSYVWMAFGDALYWLANFADYVVAYVVPRVAPVLTEMGPQSAFMTQQLPANLAAEQANVPTRVGIVHTTDNAQVGGVWRAIGMEPGWAQYVSDGIYMGGAMLMYWADYLMNSYDPYDFQSYHQSMEEAMALQYLASFAFLIDPAWCYWIGSWNGNGCSPSDAVLPATAQRYPDAIAVASFGSAAHGQETERAYGAIDNSLREYFHITAR